MITNRSLLAVTAAVALPLAAALRGAPGPVAVSLPNASFEQAGKGRVDSYTKAGVVAPVGESFFGLPDGWSAYQWGAPRESRFRVAVEMGAGHSGAAGLRLENLDATAKGGVYTHPTLEAGTYELAIWARTPPGTTARLAMYLASAYSPPQKVTESWTRLSFENVVDRPLDRAEINVQNASGEPSVIWVDDVQLLRLRAHRFELVPDTRLERPRTLLFSPMNITYLRDTARPGPGTLRGFLRPGDVELVSDVWAADGCCHARRGRRALS